MRAPEFCLLDYLDSRENGISRILANLLDPMGSHGQGDVTPVSSSIWN